MNWRTNCRVFLTPVIMFLAATSVVAQSTAPTVEEVLSRTRANVAATLATLPSVFCDEKMTSSELRDGKPRRVMTFDSVLSIKNKNGGEEKLIESRDVRLVNGRPPKEGKKYVLPWTFDGGFGLLSTSFLSSEHDQCNTYRIVNDGDSTESLLGLEVSRKADSQKIAGCEVFSAVAVDRFWLDPASYEVHRIEIMARLPNGSQGFRVVKGKNDFAAVQFGAKSYLLPSSAHMSVTMEPGSSEEFAFEAYNSKCHKFEASSSIVSDSIEESH